MSKRCLLRFAIRHAYHFVANVNRCVTVLRLDRKLTGKTTGEIANLETSLYELNQDALASTLVIASNVSDRRNVAK